MTRSKADERTRSAPRKQVTFARELRDGLLAQLTEATSIRLPSARYAKDPVAFFREILGVEPWSKQVEIIEAVRDHARVAVRSGHKVSKSHTAAGLALWYFCSFPDARVVMTSTTSRQVDQILWREVKMLLARSGRCLACKAKDPHGTKIARPCPHSAIIINEEPPELARTGIKSEDFREIVGFTAKEAEAVAGISGANLFYIADEASGIPQGIFDAIEGNRAGGARIVMFGNPTQTEGEHFEAFHSKAKFYKSITVSSEETPNVVQDRIVIPGLATRPWIEERKQEWGEDSPLYKVRVKGVHVLNEDGKIFSIAAIAKAQERWHETPETGRLFVGLDPAGATGEGDESMFCARRDYKQLALVGMRGLNDEQHLVHLLSFVMSHSRKKEPHKPVVVLDREGPIGSALAGRLRSFLEEQEYPPFELVTVRASDKAQRKPQVYDRMRDELAANLEIWLREGGALLEDVKLTAELHHLTWTQRADGKLKLTPKEDIRKYLGRSPDRYDATALSVWEPMALVITEAPNKEQEDDGESSVTLDPYAGSNAWR